MTCELPLLTKAAIGNRSYGHFEIGETADVIFAVQDNECNSNFSGNINALVKSLDKELVAKNVRHNRYYRCSLCTFLELLIFLFASRVFRPDFPPDSLSLEPNFHLDSPPRVPFLLSISSFRENDVSFGFSLLSAKTSVADTPASVSHELVEHDQAGSLASSECSPWSGRKLKELRAKDKKTNQIFQVRAGELRRRGGTLRGFLAERRRSFPVLSTRHAFSFRKFGNEIKAAWRHISGCSCGHDTVSIPAGSRENHCRRNMSPVCCTG